MLELVRQSFCLHVKVLPEAASIVFGGGFPRERGAGVQRAGQRAIFYVQRELEAAADAENAAIVLCDRGTVDGAAYWPGPGSLWDSIADVRRLRTGAPLAPVERTAQQWQLSDAWR